MRGTFQVRPGKLAGHLEEEYGPVHARSRAEQGQSGACRRRRQNIAGDHCQHRKRETNNKQLLLHN